uniref:leucine-rich repeat and IQ domain-containing protein 3 isoform X3 n=1 Tax=Myodes glareolus TaxID=447135 RepID=UPI0020219533|nr:leucine-rich repeat and IQ domain-containing protein 3 isoform X3 [Myodes glareolus]
MGKHSEVMFHGTITKELTSHEEWSHYNENIIEDQKDFVFVKYNGLHLKSMENLQSCISLRVCIFSNNFVTDIQPLQSCVKLIKLDLHGNQIKTLPDRNFWGGLKNLKLLYLHDNGFAKLKNICVLAACASLVGLTMFDCPGTTYEDEINTIKHVISRINEILAHNSPVLIVQRWIRGFIVRKHLRPYFTRKRPPGKLIRSLQTKWICKGRRHEDKSLEEIFLFKPESNTKGKVANWKQARCISADFKYSLEYMKHISCLSNELKTKDIDRKPKTPKPPTQKGQKESKSDVEDEEVDTRFRMSVVKTPLYSPRSLKYGAMLREMKRDYFPDYLQPLPATRPKPAIERETLQQLRQRREFLTSQRTGMKLDMLYDLDKYHSERKHQEKQSEKSAAVVTAQIAQERAKLNIRESLRKKAYMAQKLEEKDNEIIHRGLRQIWEEKLAYLEKVRERKTTFLAEKKLNAADHSLVQTINNERSHLLRGIVHIDRMKQNMADLRQKCLDVNKKWNTEKYKQSLMRQMKELRAEEVRKRHCEEKFVMNTLIFQKACARLEEAKAKADFIRTYYTSKSLKR